MSRTKKEILFEEDVETQELDKKIDNQVLNIITPLPKKTRKPYMTPKFDKIKNALAEMLGKDNEIVINQVEMRKKLGISLPTWLKHKKTLETEFEFIRQQRGTTLRRKIKNTEAQRKGL